MAANPRMVSKNIQVTWDSVVFNVTAGTIVDIPAGSALETAYGTSNLVSLTGSQQSGDSDTEPIFAEG